jgi:C1A family cysteine protease
MPEKRHLHTRHVKRYGWTPDLPDARDFLFTAPESVLSALPTQVDLRSKCPPVYDQGQLGSCTANAIGAAFEFMQNKQSLTDFVPSRLFVYYNEREVEGTVSQDSGAMIRDGIKSVNQLGSSRH